MEEVLARGSGAEAGMAGVLARLYRMLGLLANCVLQEQPPLRRKKIENLIGEYVHKRSVLRLVIKNKVENNKDFEWLRQMRFYYDPKQTDVLKQLSIHMANAKFNYGFEYSGVQQKLVQTPMTDRCYPTMTQALEAKLGTGMTETSSAGSSSSSIMPRPSTSRPWTGSSWGCARSAPGAASTSSTGWPAGGEDPVGRVPADSDHPGDPQVR